MPRSIRAALLPFILLLTLYGCSGLGASVHEPGPTMLAPVELTRTASPSATATVVASPTATLQPTATLLPSPTPGGFIANYDAGFSITYPLDWRILDQTDNRLTLGDPGSEIYMMIESSAIQWSGGVETLVKLIRQDAQKDETVTEGQKSTILLADGVRAEKMEVLISTPESSRDAWLIQTQGARRSYHILIIAPQDTLASRQATMERILGSLSVFEPRPYGLPRGETLFMLGGNPEGKSLDPATTTTSAADYVGMLFSGLVRLAPDMRIVPDLAENWTIDEGGKVYTFTLRKGIAFSEGEPITAQTVKDSWERACEPKTKSTTARTYLGDIQGVKERLDGKTDQIEGIKVIDERTLQVTLDAPKPYFLAKLTYPTAFVVDVSEARDDPEKWMFQPHTSGPFMVNNTKDTGGHLLERNPYYWQPAGVTYVALLNRPGGSAVSLFEEGALDILSIGSQDLKEVSRVDDPNHAALQTVPSLCTQMVMLNPNLPPLDDPLVRQAFIQATDRKDILEKLTANTALLANGILPPAMPGAKSSRVLPAYDPGAARDSLEKSKYAGQELQITLVSAGYADSQRDDVALLADGWQKALGVKVKVEYLDPSTYTQAARRHPGNAILYGWCADYPDPQDFLDVLFQSESDFNLSGLKDAEVDNLLEQARTEALPARRLQLYQKVEERLLAEGYVLPLFNNIIARLVNARVLNYPISAGETQILDLVKLRR